MNIIPFQFGVSPFRATTQDGEPYFCAADACKALGLDNVSRAIDGLEKDEVTNSKVMDSIGRMQDAVFVSESGLYALIFKSRKPEAKAFRKWVTSEVLPAIRKTGGYLLPQSLPAALRALADAEEQKAQLAIANAEMQPKVEYFDCAMTSKKGLLIRDVAKLLHDAVPGGMGEHRLFEWLRKNRWLFLTPDKQNRPYQDKVDAGYLVTNEYPVATNNHGTLNKITVRITPKGRFALHRALLKEQEQNEKEAA
jgi:anti-repressor protein